MQRTTALILNFVAEDDVTRLSGENKYCVFWKGADFRRVEAVAPIVARLWRLVADDDRLPKERLQGPPLGARRGADNRKEFASVLFRVASTSMGIFLAKLETGVWALDACVGDIDETARALEPVDGTSSRDLELWERGEPNDDEEISESVCHPSQSVLLTPWDVGRGPLRLIYQQVDELPSFHPDFL